uniref:DNA-directed RNA polymerase subunit beta n=1 Tax=Panulirus argus virus 1 TaxID=380624 RepID=A0A6G9HDL5_9VIRU|nr:DNA-dependent RNA polymerase subunit RPB2 [Panulirus argus virus 1]
MTTTTVVATAAADEEEEEELNNKCTVPHLPRYQNILNDMNHFYSRILPTIFYRDRLFPILKERKIYFTIERVEYLPCRHGIKQTLQSMSNYTSSMRLTIRLYMDGSFAGTVRLEPFVEIPVMIGTVFDGDHSMSTLQKYENGLVGTFIVNGMVKISSFEEQLKYNTPISFCKKSKRILFDKLFYVDETVREKAGRGASSYVYERGVYIKYQATERTKGTLWRFFILNGRAKAVQLSYTSNLYLFDHEEPSPKYLQCIKDYFGNGGDAVATLAYVDSLFEYVETRFSPNDRYFYQKKLITVAKYLEWQMATVPNHVANILQQKVKRNIIDSSSPAKFICALRRFFVTFKQVNNRMFHALKTNNWNIPFKVRKESSSLNIIESLDRDKNGLVYDDHLGKISSSINNVGNKVDKLRFYDDSSALFICPHNSPDGRKIGLIKQLSVGTRLSVAPAEPVSATFVLDALSSAGMVRGDDVGVGSSSALLIDGTVTCTLKCRRTVYLMDVYRCCMAIKRVHPHVSVYVRDNNVYVDSTRGRPMINVRVNARESFLFDSAECWHLDLSRSIMKNMDAGSAHYPRLCCTAAAFSAIVGKILNYKAYVDGKRLFYMTRLFHHAITNRLLPGKLALVYPQLPTEYVHEKLRRKRRRRKSGGGDGGGVSKRRCRFGVGSNGGIADAGGGGGDDGGVGGGGGGAEEEEEEERSRCYQPLSPTSSSYDPSLYTPLSPVYTVEEASPPPPPPSRRRRSSSPDAAVPERRGGGGGDDDAPIDECMYQLVVTLHMNDIGNMEDGIIINKASVERGLFSHTEQRTVVFAIPQDKILGKAATSRLDYVDGSGMIKRGTFVTNDTNVLVNAVLFGMDDYFNLTTYDTPLLLAGSCKLNGFKTERVEVFDGNVKLHFSKLHFVTEGDKLTSRHGQKGVVCQIRNAEDMPFDSAGNVPDIIVNGNSTLKRLSLGVYEELKLSGENAASIRVKPTFSGITGKCLGVHEWGLLAYIALDQIASNKKYICIPTQTNKQTFTGQPKEGRSQEGGFRVGVLEVASIRASGSLQFLRDRMLTNSDQIHVLICSRCKMLQHNKSVTEGPGETVKYTCSFCDAYTQPLTLPISKCMKFIFQLLGFLNIKITLTE